MQPYYLLLIHPWTPWVAGLVFSLGFGHVAVYEFLVRLRLYMNLGSKPGQESITKAVPSWLMGVGERFFFTIAVGVNLSGAGVAMMAWIAIKMAANWNRPGPPNEEEEDLLIRKRFALSAAVAGMMSMIFALLGGLICKGKIWPS